MRAQRRRDLAALAGALAVHAALLVVAAWTPTRRMFHEGERQVVEVEIVTPRRAEGRPPATPPTTAPTTTPPPPATPPTTAPPTTTTPPATPPPTTTPATTSPEADHVEAPVAAAPPAVDDNGGESLVRLPKGDGVIGKILGTGGALGPSATTLERSLDARADGPMSDARRAATNARRYLETDLSDDEVTVGLADDYFRELKNRVETNWRPAMKELNDGGKAVTQLGMLKGFVDDDGRVAWNEMWLAYLDLAKQYAQGERPSLEPRRIERLRELMRSRRGAFRFHAITEVVLTQGPDGKVVTVELPLSSGHPGIDEGVKDAITTAVDAMRDPPPARVHHGRSFSSTWRFRATWTMVPPTALLTGAGFDITPKGFQVDVPFDIKLKTYVMLLHTDAHAHAEPASVPD